MIRTLRSALGVIQAVHLFQGDTGHGDRHELEHRSPTAQLKWMPDLVFMAAFHFPR